MKHLLPSLILATLVALPCGAHASEFREINRINRAGALPDGAKGVAAPIPVSREEIRRDIEKILASWNTPAMEGLLSEKFHNKDRLLDTVSTFAGRDARLRLLSLQNINTLQQYQEGGQLVSRVSVIARTQIEYTTPTAGARTADGTVEYILKIRQPLKGGV